MFFVCSTGGVLRDVGEDPPRAEARRGRGGEPVAEGCAWFRVVEHGRDDLAMELPGSPRACVEVLCEHCMLELLKFIPSCVKA